MINKIKVNSGFAKKLPMFKKELEFKSGLNILFGPNGCGKTTALNIAAAYCSIKNNGWTKLPAPFDVKGFSDKKCNFPEDLSNICVGKCKADVEWDGTPTYYSASKAEQVVPHAFSDDQESMVDELNMMFSKPSSGQLRLHNLAKTIHKLKAPNLFDYEKNVNDVWKTCYSEFCDYLKTLPRSGKITLLIDEPDRSLSLPVQFELWTKAIPQWSEHMQVIVATHSPFCLIAKGNIIECVDGYVEECKKCLKEAFN